MDIPGTPAFFFLREMEKDLILGKSEVWGSTGRSGREEKLMSGCSVWNVKKNQETPDIGSLGH